MNINVQQKELFMQLDNSINNFVKDKIELIMREELGGFLDESDVKNSRNGYYERNLDTEHGRINSLKVPRDRNGEFQTHVFDPYQRRTCWLEEAVIRMYQSGMSTREVGQFIERILGYHYSPTTISNITDSVLEDIEKWRKRPLEKRYIALYLDGMYMKVRRKDVESEVVYCVLGVKPNGIRELLSFSIGGKESSHGWEDVLKDLYERGVREVLVGIFDGLTGLENSFKRVFPRAKVQRCVVHKIRNTSHKIRVKDRHEFLNDLKPVYKSETKLQGKEAFEKLRKKWDVSYKRELDSWENELGYLLTFYDFPREIQRFLYTTNTIERFNKEIRKRLKPMNSLPNIQAAEKIVYLCGEHYNDAWSKRKLAGFEQCKQSIKDMFIEQYE